MKLAIVHEFLMSYGGAERVLEHVHEVFPDAPVYTIRHNPEAIGHKMDNWDIRTSIIERMPIIKKRGHTMAMPLYPLAVESFDLREFDVVLSMSSAFSHGVITQPGTTHLCYYHTPARFLWDYHFPYLKEKGWDKGIKGAAAQRFLHHLRQWDWLAAQRPDKCFANAKTIQKRVKKFYGRDSEVIYPGIDLTNYELRITNYEDYFVTVSRLSPPKKIDLAVAACTELKRPLHVIGTGEHLEYLKSIAGPTVKFLGFLSDSEVAKELAGGRALLWPGIDDFGLVPVEAMACGTPVVAYNKDGATETVIDGKTGILYDDYSTKGVVDGIKQLDEIYDKLDSKFIHTHAQQFSKENFQKNIKQAVDEAYSSKKH